MALPKQVRDQIKEANKIAEEIEKEISANNENKDLNEQENKKLEENQEVQANKENLKKDLEEKPKEKQEDTADQEINFKQEKTPEDTSEGDDWKHKYQVLQGKYDAEVPRQSREIRKLNSELNEVRSLLANIKKAEEKPKEKPVEPEVFVNAEEIEEYGADFIDLVGRRAQEVANPLIDKLQKEIQNLRNELQTVRQDVGSTSQNQFLSLLDQQVENWRTLNQDPQFLDWLDVTDEFSGLPRGEMLRNAYDNGDVNRVARFFQRFQNENAAVSGYTQPAEQTAKVDMDQLVAPGKPKTQQPADAPQDKRIWTQDEIGRFYSDVQKGRFKKRLDEKNKIERDIVAAAAEGRVR